MSAVSGPVIHRVQTTSHPTALPLFGSSTRRPAPQQVHFGNATSEASISAKKALYELAKYPFKSENALMARSLILKYLHEAADVVVFLPAGFLLYYPVLGLAKLFQKSVGPRWRKQLEAKNIQPPEDSLDRIKSLWEGKNWQPTKDQPHIVKQFEKYLDEVQDLINRIFQHEAKESDILKAVRQYRPKAQDANKGLGNRTYQILSSAFYSDAYYQEKALGKFITFMKSQGGQRNTAATVANRIIKNRLLRVLTRPMRIVGLAFQAITATHFRLSGKMARELAKAIR